MEFFFKHMFIFVYILSFAKAETLRSTTNYVDILDEKLNQLTKFNDMLSNKLNTLETRTSDLESIVAALTRENSMMHDKLDEMDQKIEERDATIEALRKTNHFIDKTLEKERHEEDNGPPLNMYEGETNQPTRGLVTNQTGQETRTFRRSEYKGISVEALLRKRQLSSLGTNKVAFFATIAPHDLSGFHFGSSIVFDNVVTNLGSAYHSHHGLFIAPVHGVYQFSFTMAFNDNAVHWTFIGFVRNGDLIAQVRGNPSDMAGHTAILELQQDDEIYIVYRGGGGGIPILGDHYSSFAGVLLFSLE